MVLVLVALNILFFAWTDGETRGAVEWMLYGFTLLVFIFACISVFRIRRDNNEVYNLTITYLSITYFAQTILSVIAIYYEVVLRKTSEVTNKITETVNDSINNLADKSGEILPDSIQGLAVDSIGSSISDTVKSATEVVAKQPSFFAEHYTVIVLSVFILVLVFYAIYLGAHSTANKATKKSLTKQEEEH